MNEKRPDHCQHCWERFGTHEWSIKLAIDGRTVHLRCEGAAKKEAKTALRLIPSDDPEPDKAA